MRSSIRVNALSRGALTRNLASVSFSPMMFARWLPLTEARTETSGCFPATDFPGGWRSWLAHQHDTLGVTGSSPVPPNEPNSRRTRRTRNPPRLGARLSEAGFCPQWDRAPFGCGVMGRPKSLKPQYYLDKSYTNPLFRTKHRPVGKVGNYCNAFRPLKRLYADKLARDFGPLAPVTVRNDGGRESISVPWRLGATWWRGGRLGNRRVQSDDRDERVGRSEHDGELQRRADARRNADARPERHVPVCRGAREWRPVWTLRLANGNFLRTIAGAEIGSAGTMQVVAA
ncbi:MAG: hypothetical protein JWP03_4305 [Phycisphaerales bacterium]|nr:hypothetical protein [Phycisphaerales bacterium]